MSLLLTALLVIAGGCKKNQDRVQRPLAVTSFFPTSGLAHTLVTIYGSGFGADTSLNSVSFNGVKAAIFQVTDTSLVVLAPDGGTTGSLSITAGGRTVTAGTYTYQLLSLHSVSPLNGPAGTNVVVTGAGLSGKTGPASVTFNGRAAVVISSNDTSLVASVPDSAGVGPVVVKVDASTATGPVFTFQAISFISPLTGGAGTLDSIHGVGFGTDASKIIAAANGTMATVMSVADTMVVVRMPSGVQTGPVSITMNGQKTVGPVFTVVPAPSNLSLVPTSGPAGTSDTIRGRNFSAILSQNQVDYNGVAATVVSATASQLVALVPAGASTGPIHVSVNGQTVQGPVFTVQALNITALTPNNGMDGTTVEIAGNGFSVAAGGNQVFFNGMPATVTNATATSLTVTAPVGFTSGNVTVQTGGLTATGPMFYRAGVKTIYTDLSLSFLGLAIDGAGNIYYTSRNASGSTNTIMKLSPDGGTRTLFAGSPTGQSGSQDGTLSTALFNNPGILAFDRLGNLWVADNGNGSIRMISPSGDVSTMTSNVGYITNFAFDTQNKCYFSVNLYGGTSGVFLLSGNNYAPAFKYPYSFQCGGISFDGSGNLYYFDASNGGVLMEHLLAANKNITASSAFNGIGAMAQDPTTGDLIVADRYALGFYSFDGYSGAQSLLFQPSSGMADGTLDQSKFMGVGVMSMDNNGVIYVVDGGNQQPSYIRKIFLR